jgi:rubredoxin
MRFKDYLQTLGISLVLGFVFSVVFYFIWSDEYISTSNSFWISWFGLGVISLPIGYWSAKKNSTCPKCSKSFVISGNGQTDIENFVKYKSESVTQNGITRTENVPYNVRRYHQHMKCDSCGYEYKFETKSESKA